jgi:hypothetical protein
MVSVREQVRGQLSQLRSAQRNVGRQGQLLQRREEQLRGRINRLTSRAASASVTRQGLAKRNEQLQNLQSQLSDISQAGSKAAQVRRQVNQRIQQLERVQEALVSPVVQGLSSEQKDIFRAVEQGRDIRKISALPTALERELKQSLPPGIRETTLPEFQLGISIPQTGREISSIERDLRQSIPTNLQEIPQSTLPDIRQQARTSQKQGKPVLGPLIQSIREFEAFERNKKGEITDVNLGGILRIGGEALGTPGRAIQAGAGNPDNILTQPTGVTAQELATDLFFTPALLFGTAGRATAGRATAGRSQSAFVEVRDATGKLIGFKKKKSGLGKSFAEEFQEALTQSRFATNAGQEADFRLLTRRGITEALKTNDPKKALTRLQDFYKKAGRTDLFDDLLAQEGIDLTKPILKDRVVNVAGSGRTTGGRPASIPGSSLAPRAVADLPTAVGGGGRSSSPFAGRGASREVAPFTEFRGLGGIRRRLGVPSKFGLGSALVTNTLQKAAAGQAQLPLSLQRSGQTTRQVSPTAQRPRVGQRGAPRLRTATGLVPRLRQPSATSTPTPTRLGRPRLRPRGPFGIPTIPLENGKRVRTQITGGLPRKFDVFTRKKGKFTRISKKPLSRSDALDFGAHHVDTTLRASFLIKPSSRKGIGKIKPRIKGSFSKNIPELRAARSAKLRGALVEKRRFRLDSKSEVGDIKRAKRISKPKLKSKSMIRRRR